MQPDPTPDGPLVLAARAGDRDAFTTLFRRWSDRCYDVARRVLGDEGRAAEVAQDTMLVAWTQLDTLRDPDAFGGWVLRTARNKALNRLEHERRARPADDTHPVMATLAAPTDVEGSVTAAEQQAMVAAAAAALGERDASILDLHLRHGLGAAEIGDELGVTTNNAHQLLFRMKQRLGSGLRAWILFRGGDPTCEALAADLRAAGVSGFGPDAVKVVGRHVGGCADCEGRQAAVLAPEAMFAGVPVLLLPAEARAAVVDALRGAGVPLGPEAANPTPADPLPDAAADAAAEGPGSEPGAGDGGAGGGSGGPPESTGRAGGSGSAGGGRRRGLVVGAVAAAVLVVIGVAVLLGGRSSDRDSISEATSTTRPEAVSSTSTTLLGGGGDSDPDGSGDGESPVTAPSTTVPDSGDLVGAWVADAGDILGANTANVGGPGGITCAGPITMTFTDEGTYSRSGSVTCTVGGQSASGTVATSGRYEADGSTLTIVGTANDGELSIGGGSAPMPDAWGDATADYEVIGGTLTITFTDPSVGTVTQVYARS